MMYIFGFLRYVDCRSDKVIVALIEIGNLIQTFLCGKDLVIVFRNINLAFRET